MTKSHKKYSVLLALLLAAVLTIPFAKAAEAANGKADFRRIFLSMPEHKAAQQQYDKMAEQKAAEYGRLAADAKDEQTKRQLEQQYETWRAQANVEIMAPVVNKAQQVINQVAAEKKLERIYDAQSSAAAEAETDITTDVIVRLAQDRTKHQADAAKQPAKTEAKPVQTVEPQPKPAAKPVQTVKPQPKPAAKPVRTVKAKPEPAAENKPAKAEAPAKAENPQEKAQSAAASGGAIVIQFGADTEPYEIQRWVARAKKKGIASAYVEENVNAKGRKWWRARASADSKAEAEAICAKLRAMRLKYYIVR